MSLIVQFDKGLFVYLSLSLFVWEVWSSLSKSQQNPVRHSMFVFLEIKRDAKIKVGGNIYLPYFNPF